MRQLLRNPSAYLPPLMSLAALITVGVHVALFGVARQADEGTAAHIWQILIAAQLPIIGFFAVKWFSRDPLRGFAVLVLQAVAVFVALLPVYLLGF